MGVSSEEGKVSMKKQRRFFSITKGRKTRISVEKDIRPGLTKTFLRQIYGRTEKLMVNGR